MANLNKTRWWVDLTLLIVFILTFFMDLTGLTLHQWIGVATGLLAVYHLATHWNWVKIVSERFFWITSNRARLYYLIDAALFGGLGAIILTGLMISTWFNFAEVVFPGYSFWYFVHVAASVLTLLSLALKIGLHWRWILTHAPGAATQPQPTWRGTATAVGSMSRRDFLKVVGLTAAVAAFPLGKALSSLQEFGTGAASPSSSGQTQGLSTFQDYHEPGSTSPQTGEDLPEAAATEGSNQNAAASSTAAPRTYSQPAATATHQASSAGTSTTSCQVRCNRRCSYPGRCHRYIDTNGDNLCDNGQCV